MSSRPFYAVGAYGRTANLKDWNDGKDFASHSSNNHPGGRYFSKRDVGWLRDHGFTEIRFISSVHQSKEYGGMSIGFRVEI